MDNLYAQRPLNQIPGSSNPNPSSSAQNTSSTQLPYTQMPTYYPNYNPYVNLDQQVSFQQWQLKQQFQHTQISQQLNQAASSQHQSDQQSHQPQQPQEEEADTTPTSAKTKRKRIKKMSKDVKKRGRVTDEEPELFGDDELPCPPGKERIAKSQRSTNSSASSGSNPAMFQDMLQQQYELDRATKMERIDRETNARVELINSQKVAEDLKVLQINTREMDPVEPRKGG
ncbi:hypothetical protein Tco_0938682 [Tanacetum coccineum]|uniref:No apical meristem-associated C-terminal domain-containing protein n=1 Tax=Tanacetum coccineum TaxID=301880 RepID=A0ABQ5DII5_9ASTR